MMPLTIAETIRTEANTSLISKPSTPDKDTLEALINFGGFPEPLLRNSSQFYNRWKKTRTEQLFYEDLRDTSRVHEIKQIEILAQILAAIAGNQINYSSIATDINASVDSVKRWIALLQSSHYCFELRPYHVNVPKSLRKQPKIYLYDWSLLKDKGARNENFAAIHLKKAVDLWNDLGQ